jgi:Fe-S cluster assembly protein SufD
VTANWLWNWKRKATTGLKRRTALVNLDTKIEEIPIPSSFNDKLKEYRAEGHKRYNESGLPGRKIEHWMKFDISPLKSRTYSEGKKSANSPEKEINKVFTSFCEKIEIINGFVNCPDAHKSKMKEHYTVSTVSTDQGKNEISREIGNAGDVRGNYFYNLNSSLFTDPLLITSLHNREKPPLYLSQTVLNREESIIANSRIIIVVEEGASLDLIQSFSGEGSENYLNNSVTEIILHKNATLNHLILNEDSDKAYLFNNLFVKQEKGSIYNSQTLIAGAAISRNEYDISLNEENCKCSVTCLFLGKEEQLHNSDITIHHDAPGCTSNTVTKAISSGNSQGVFRGFAMVSPGAQKTDAIQQFKTILLGDNCQVNMEPHLEIWADDVKCSHGATVGQLDKEQLFYLQSRGYTPDQAKKMLLEAFAADVAESISIGKASDIMKSRIYTLMEDLYE